MKLSRLILLLLWLGSSSFCLATTTDYAVSRPLARELVAHHGLTQNIVTSMVEDQFGRFWIGTQDGVNVVDGNSIRLISSNTTKQQLLGKVVIAMVSDLHNRVWVATTQGLNSVSSKDFSINTVQYQNSALTGIRQMLLLDTSRLALLVGHDLLLLDLNSGVIKPVTKLNGQIEQLGLASNGLVIKTQTELLHYRADGSLSELLIPAELKAGSGQFILQDKTLWFVSAQQQLMRCQQELCQPMPLPDQAGSVQHPVRINLFRDTLYLLRNDDVLLYSATDNNFRLIQPQLPVNSYTTTSTDAGIKVLSTGEIITGRRQGVLIIPDTYPQISSYPEFSSLTGHEIYALTAVTTAESTEPQLLIASKNRLELHQLVAQKPILRQQIHYPQDITPALFIRFNDELLLSALMGKIFHVDVENNRLTPWLPELPELSGLGTLIDIVRLDSRHHLLLFHQHLVLLQQQAAGYQPLWTSKIPSTKTAKMIYQDQRLLIAAYQQGVLSSEWTDWSKAPVHWQTQLAGNPALDFRRHSDGSLQLLTAEQGVQQLSLSAAGISATSLSDPGQLLSSTAVCAETLSAQLWAVATHDGIALYNPQHQLLRQLTIYDGVVQREFDQYKCGAIGELAYFAGEHGLSLVGAGNTVAPQHSSLRFTQLLADGKAIEFVQSPVVLTEPNTIIANYSYAPYPVIAPVRFQFRLEPGNDEWFETTATTLRYTQLAPGQYKLNLRAVRFDGTHSDTIQLGMSIKPLFWRSPQAYVLYSLTLVLILWFYFRQRWQIQQAKLQVAETQHKFQIEYTDKLEEAVRLRTAKLEQQQQEFLLLQQEKIEFLTTSSHDLKNLSALIQLNLADVNKYLLPTGQDSWRNVHSSCKLLNTLVDDILELSKLKAGVVTPNLQPVQLSYLLQQIYQPFKLMAEERGINLQLTVNEELVVLTDPYLLARLLMNLLDNALKNLSSGHSVQLEIKKRYRTSRQVYLLVRDSGPGLPEHMRRHWGLAFQRGSTSYQGTGLGLSIVKKIAELLVLPVSLYSSDRGTCFELRLQQAELQDQPSSPSVGHAAIIESDPQARQFLYYELVRRGYQVSVFDKAKDFARTGQRGFRVLISDIHFNASEDTIADLALLKSCLEPHGKLIFVSSDASVRHRLPEETQLYFMVKPVKRSRLAWLLAKES